MRLRALAKINLGLDVVRKREDGYHEVRMVMQTVNLFDTLEISRTSGAGVTMETNRHFLPVDDNNLCVRAAKLMQEEFDLSGGLHIRLFKRIPVAAGMAGGSSDAAAVLFGLNRMYGLGLTRRELMRRGVSLGADVPYCVMRGTALAEGIGEKLRPLPAMVKCPVLVAKPPISVSTKTVYERLDSLEQPPHPDMDGLLEALRARDLNRIAGSMGNILESVTIPMHPVISQIKDVMVENGAINAMMSGSGPSVFGLFADEATLKQAKRALRESGYAAQIYGTTIYNNRR